MAAPTSASVPHCEAGINDCVHGAKAPKLR
jgi:hypothetical protein